MTLRNMTSEDGETEWFPLYITIPGGIVMTVLIVLAVVGNVMTIAAFIRDKKLRNVYNTYLVNLATTDLCLGLVSMPFYAIYTLKNYSWPFGYHFCKAFLVIDFTLCLESVLMMIIISLDRLLLLRFGPHYTHKVTKTVALVQLIVSWILAFGLYGPAIIGWDKWTGEDTNEPGDCDVQFAYDFGFTTATAVVEFAIPFLAIGILNLLIYLDIRKRTKIGPFPPSKTTTVIQRTNLSRQTAISRAAKDVKAARFLAMLVVVFGITWAPYTITTIIISFEEDSVNKDAYEFLNWVLWCKASLNPFLYAFNSQRFLKNFKEMCSCKERHRNIVTEPTVSGDTEGTEAF